MEFYIAKNATLPLLKMQVVQDGRSSYLEFMESLPFSTIYFTMIDYYTGVPKIVSAPCYITSLILTEPGAGVEYYIYFQFTSMDTDTPGRYQGQFLIKNEEGNLILPLREQLYINIEDSFIAESPCC